MRKYALLSVSDKEGIVEFAKGLVDNDFEILATGNTAKLLIESEIHCTKIEDYTSFPEIFSGRVKTLQPQIFGGILMRRDNDADIEQAIANNIKAIDVVCVNLYPFPNVVNRVDIDLQTKIENIDIGGPSLIRAAAKNYKFVSILTNPNQYKNFLTELEQGDTKPETRVSLASAAFAHTAFYDTLIANYFEKEFNQPKGDLRISNKLQVELRYGENPHQKAYLYGDFYKNFEVLHGKELSYNNIIDFSAAVELILDLEPNSCAIIKHTNPCGAAKGTSVLDAYEKALSCDPVSAFGGIVAFNNPIDVATAEKLNEIFLEIICAPEFSDEVLEILKKKKNRRLVKINYTPTSEEFQFKNIPGGVITQSKDTSNLAELELKNVTERKYTEAELNDLKFAWVICKHTKSNAIVYIKDEKAIGVGAGQMSRVDSARIAVMKAKEHGHDLTGAVAASDAFFPFADGLIEIAENGITAVIQPGGSVRDEEVIEAANKYKLAMIFTGIRNFKTLRSSMGIFDFFSTDVAIDLGTANTLIHIKGKGIVLNEPSIVAFDRNTKKIIALGNEAKEMQGREHREIRVSRPMRDGVIADFEIAEGMIRAFVKQVTAGAFTSSRIIVAVPSGVTEVEKRAVRDSTEHAGAKEVHLIAEPMAAAIGIGLDVEAPVGNMIIDIGGGTTEIAVIALSGIVNEESIRVAGDEMNNAIMQFFKKNYNLLIGERTAESIKCEVGSAVPLKEEVTIQVKGRDLVGGIPKTAEVSSVEIREALNEAITQIVEAVKQTLERTPPELSADILDRGVILAGGGALLKGLDERIRMETNLPVHVADDPLTAVVRGAGMCIDNINKYSKVFIRKRTY